MSNAPQRGQSTAADLQLCIGGFSSKGLKAENEDAFAAIVPDSHELRAKGAVAAIADGLSSANKAADASQLAVTQFIQEYLVTPETWSTQKSAAKVLTSLNNWLYSQGGFVEGLADENSPQWLTTFSALIAKSTTGYIFHVGDTRITKYRNQQLEVITRDHNRKQIGQQALLTRALGADNRLEVDVHKVDLQSGDLYMLSCDGIHDYITKATFQSLFDSLPLSPKKSDLEALSIKIVNTALEQGSNDNVTCLLVYVQAVPNRKLAEIQRDLSAKSIPPALKVGQKLDGYLVKKVIHASIRSHLYLVIDVETDKPYVLKAPSANFADDAIYLQGFMREAWVGERIKHGNVMRVLPGRKNSQFLYHVCEYLQGQTLGEWLHDNPKPSIALVRDIMKQVISALRAFQRLDLVHRDLKPDNIMIDQYGHIKLIDYGTVFVASLDENQETIKEEVPFGSLNYIAPETLLHMKADNQSDLFSLGVICYEMLSGELPYKPMQRAEVTIKDYNSMQYRSIKQFRPELPLWLDLSLQKATEADPRLRYKAFSEFFADLSNPKTNAVEEYKSQPLLKRNPILFWQSLSALLFVGLIAALLH
ncbi:bifunctional protein-serine/threonine kinase/phosphatase [Colwellia sp. 6M3]|jgi:serine/threonine protein phosphatase PrpC|uniref:bifunctional protein-serine/threonine kinase/phosphatase n=1 Tax=Colwellia sp. 6M3 TaxID=2759849 RepID=UPI0015F3FDF5|nr:bifunctional protein-serine/threonine kinase/phosphatase [Colwellia sp. 6M3]MBA6416745.1 bifunctional protein-serine/threonine kinase/phosphatase [Colwellia sp. 6M3]